MPNNESHDGHRLRYQCLDYPRYFRQRSIRRVWRETIVPKKTTTIKDTETHVAAADTIHARVKEDLAERELRLHEIDQETRELQTELGLLAPALQAKKADLAAARHAKQRAADEERRAEKLAMYSIG